MTKRSQTKPIWALVVVMLHLFHLAPSASAAPIPVASYVYDGTGSGASPSTGPAFPDTGMMELTDEMLPARTAFGDPGWVGFQQRLPDDTGSHPQVTFDLGVSCDLETIEVSYLHSTSQAGGSISAPEEVLISVSRDHVTFSAPVAFAGFDHGAGDQIRINALDVSNLSDARYVRLDFRQTSQWTFLAEVAFTGVIDPMIPSPSNGATVLTGDVVLSWTNLAPDTPDDPVFVDVGFGSTPEKLNPQYTQVVTAGENTTSVTVSASVEGIYYWQVDSYTGGSATGDPTEGIVYAFIASDTLPPVTVTISRPTPRHIVQRSLAGNSGNIDVSGTFTGSPETIEARAVVMPGTGNTGEMKAWQTIDAAPGGGSYTGTLSGVPAGGWYQLEVRGVVAGTPGTAIVQKKIGVGDLYVTAGQSNAANHGGPAYTPTDDRVSVRTALTGASWRHASDPMPTASGGGGSVWSRLADELAATEKVPIGFMAVGQGSSQLRQWVPGAGNYDKRLRPAVQSFPTNGFRAVLWHQGESDALAKVTAATHEHRLNTMIEQSRLDAGWDIPWFLAEAAFHPRSNLSQEEPITAGQRLAVHGDPLIFLGPSTDEFHLEDAVGGKLNDSVHFNALGLREHARQWRDILRGTTHEKPRNGSFEDNCDSTITGLRPLAEGASHIVNTTTNNDSPSVLGWRILSAAGTTAADGRNGFHNPDVRTYGAEAGVTNHVALLDGGTSGNFFLHSTRALAEPNRIYTLTVALGVRDHPATFGDARIEILANGAVVATATFDKAALDTLRGGDATGAFTDVRVSWTSGDHVADNLPLAIRIAKVAGAGTVLDFDQVRFTVLPSG